VEAAKAALAEAGIDPAVAAASAVPQADAQAGHDEHPDLFPPLPGAAPNTARDDPLIALAALNAMEQRLQRLEHHQVPYPQQRPMEQRPMHVKHYALRIRELRRQELLWRCMIT
jgi:hypothetical protein